MKAMKKLKKKQLISVIEQDLKRQFEAWLMIQLKLGNLKGYSMKDYDIIRRATIWKRPRRTWLTI